MGSMQVQQSGCVWMGGKAVQRGGMHVHWGSAMVGVRACRKGCGGGEHARALGQRNDGGHTHIGGKATRMQGILQVGCAPGHPLPPSRSPPLTSGSLEPCSPRRGPRGGRGQEQQLHSPSCRARNANPAQRRLSRGSAPPGPPGKKRGEKTQGKLWDTHPLRSLGPGGTQSVGSQRGLGAPTHPWCCFCFYTKFSSFLCIVASVSWVHANPVVATRTQNRAGGTRGVMSREMPRFPPPRTEEQEKNKLKKTKQTKNKNNERMHKPFPGCGVGDFQTQKQIAAHGRNTGGQEAPWHHSAPSHH